MLVGVGNVSLKSIVFHEQTDFDGLIMWFAAETAVAFSRN